MTQPVGSDLHVNVPLTNVANGFLQAQGGFVADRVFANVPVSKRSDLYYMFDRSAFLRGEMRVRAPATESVGVGWTQSLQSYWIPVLALHHDIDDQRRANADSIFQLDRTATALLTSQAKITRERNWVRQYFVPGRWPLGVAGGSAVASGTVLRFSDANSTPVENMRKAIRTVQLACGFKPNVGVFGSTVVDALLDHPDIIDRLKAGQTPGGPAMANVNTLAALFGLEEIIVMEAVENRAAEGAPMDIGFIGGNHILLVYRAPTPTIETPSAGYTFSWTGYLGATQDGMRFKKFRMEAIESDRIEVQMAYLQMQLMPEAGYFFADIA